MSETRIPRDFDLPVRHLGSDRHFVPPKARRSDEIDRRHGLPSGTVLAEYQKRGLELTAAILNKIEEPQDLVFTARLLAASGINTAWYSFARGASDVMRRRLKLPPIAVEDDNWRPDTATLLQSARLRFQDAVHLAGKVVTATERGVPSPWLERRQTQLGRHVGTSSLVLACAPLGDRLDDKTDFQVQLMARWQSLRALHDSRVLEAPLGSYPSLAQLAEPDSDLSVYLRRNAPDGALEAYEQAIAA